jgi:leader peptidase (prepilin peptidase)/N-methyltransferase
MTIEPWRLLLAASGPFAGVFVATFAVSWPRWPRPLVGRSLCARCGAPVPALRQAPLLGWAASRGRRVCCGGRIPLTYPLGEGAGLLMGLLVALAASGPIAGALWFGLGLILIHVALVDLRRFSLPWPDLPAVGGLGLAAQALGVQGAGLPGGLAAGAGVFAVLELLRRLFAARGRHGGLGAGDPWLAGALAIWAGPEAAAPMVLAASLLGLAWVVLRRKPGPLPFGPALALAGFGAAIVAPQLHNWGFPG